MNGIIEVIRSEPLVRERETIKARPSLASIALKERMISTRNMLVCVVGLSRVLVEKIAKRARVSRARSAGRSRVRWKRKVIRAVEITIGWRAANERRGITTGSCPIGGLQDRCF